jgi:Acetyltransferase (GNAT) domain
VKLKGASMDYGKTSEPMPLNARWYEGVAGLKQLRTDWYELSSDTQIFARYEWHLAAATHLVGDDHSIWFCRIGDDGGRPLSIVPAVTDNAVVRPFGQLPALTLGYDSQLAAFDFPLAHGANALDVGKTMLKAFHGHPYNWQVISWPRVMADSNAAKVAIALGRRLTDITPSSVCNTFYTASTPDPERDLEVFTVKSSKLRRILAQRSRRLAMQGSVQMRMASEQGDIEGFFKEFLRIESSGWKGDKGTRTAIALVPAVLGFYNSLLAESSAAFQTDIALLYCGDRAVAGEFLIRTARWEHIYKIGYDEFFTNCSPGQLLLERVIERAKASGMIDRVSLVTGLDWHNDWAPIPEPTLHINIFRSMWRPFVMRLGRRALARFRRVRSSLVAHRPIGSALPVR